MFYYRHKKFNFGLLNISILAPPENYATSMRYSESCHCLTKK